MVGIMTRLLAHQLLFVLQPLLLCDLVLDVGSELVPLLPEPRPDYNTSLVSPGLAAVEVLRQRASGRALAVLLAHLSARGGWLLDALVPLGLNVAPGAHLDSAAVILRKGVP